MGEAGRQAQLLMYTVQAHRHAHVHGSGTQARHVHEHTSPCTDLAHSAASGVSAQPSKHVVRQCVGGLAPGPALVLARVGLA